MKKVLIAVDGTKGSTAIMSVFHAHGKMPEEVVMLHVEQLGGKSLMFDASGDPEMIAFRESVQGTEYKETLDIKAKKILDFYKKDLESCGLKNIKIVIKEGRATEEILKAAEEEKVELIILGFNKKNWLTKLFTGCVVTEVEKESKIPVAIAKYNVKNHKVEFFKRSSRIESTALFA